MQNASHTDNAPGEPAGHAAVRPREQMGNTDARRPNAPGWEMGQTQAQATARRAQASDKVARDVERKVRLDGYGDDIPEPYS